MAEESKVADGNKVASQLALEEGGGVLGYPAVCDHIQLIHFAVQQKPFNSTKQSHSNKIK